MRIDLDRVDMDTEPASADAGEAAADATDHWYPKPEANLGKVVVRRLDGSFAAGLDTLVQAGDTILVPEKQVSDLLRILGLIGPFLQAILGRWA